MEIGSTEIVIEPPEKEKKGGKLTGRSTSGGKSGGGDDGGDNGGGDGPNDPNKGLRPDNSIDHELLEEVPDKAKVITWFLLLAVVMTFGGLFAAFVVLATNAATEWKPFDLPVPIYLSTILIVVSSIVYELAKRELFAGRQLAAKKYFIATAALGGIFISSQVMVWMIMSRNGIYVRANPFAGFFYILTITHVVHVIGGIIALGAVTLRTWEPTDNDRFLAGRMHLATAVGWYWHLMGVLWLLIFALLGFWR